MRRLFDFRWALDYGDRKIVGPWSLPVIEEDKKASFQPRAGLKWASIEVRYVKGEEKTVAMCPAEQYVGFKMKIKAQIPIAIGSKGGALGEARYQTNGIELITQEKIIDVFDWGKIAMRPLPAHFQNLSDLGRFIR